MSDPGAAGRAARPRLSRAVGALARPLAAPARGGGRPPVRRLQGQGSTRLGRPADRDACGARWRARPRAGQHGGRRHHWSRPPHGQPRPGGRRGSARTGDQRRRRVSARGPSAERQRSRAATSRAGCEADGRRTAILIGAGESRVGAMAAGEVRVGRSPAAVRHTSAPSPARVRPAQRRRPLVKGAAALGPGARSGRCSDSSEGAVSRGSSGLSKTAGFAAKQRSRSALPLLVRTASARSSVWAWRFGRSTTTSLEDPLDDSGGALDAEPRRARARPGAVDAGRWALRSRAPSASRRVRGAKLDQSFTCGRRDAAG
jgi:hypothetical protein